MIQAIEVYKKFGKITAVNNFHCQVVPGEIVGLLGANGAGKSTIMKMLSGCCSPDYGKILIDGYSMEEYPYIARSQIGYLPETSPSYPDLYVDEYLEYVCQLKNFCYTQDIIYTTLIQCQLENVSHKKIQHLSHGYRQRLGLAQAIICDPICVILDEPTAGLDPYQIKETRKLLQELGRKKSVLISTHILFEVEKICDRVIILQEGQIKLMGIVEELLQYGSLEEIYLQAVAN